MAVSWVFARMPEIPLTCDSVETRNRCWRYTVSSPCRCVFELDKFLWSSFELAVVVLNAWVKLLEA